MKPMLLCALLLLAALLQPIALADDIRQIPLPAGDLVYDPGTKRLYASVPGSGGARANTITAIDPLTGALGASVFIGSEPGKMALSDRGKFLWVALDGSGMVRRFDLATHTAGPQFSLGTGLCAEDLAAVPGSPETVAVARANRNSSPRSVDTTVYDNGKPRPKAAPGGNCLAFGLYGDRLYGYTNEISSFELTTMLLQPDGLERTNYAGGVFMGNVTIQYANGLLYSDNGRVADPEARQQVGQFPGIGYHTPTCVDAPTGRAFCLVDGALKAFDLKTFGEVGSLPVPGIRGGVLRLVRWGADGLAFCTTEGQVFLVRTALVPARKTPVDLVLTRTPLPSNLKAGQEAAYTLTVRNNGTVTATGVFVTDDLGKDLNVVDVKSGQGSATAADGVVRADLGDLAPGAKTTINVKVQPAKEGAYAPLAIARANETDLNPADNSAAQAMQLAGQQPVPARGIDLTGEWQSAEQTIKGAGVDLQATLEGVFLVQNTGSAPAPATKLRFYLSYTIGPFLEEDLLQEVDVPALAPGKTYPARLKARLAQGDSAGGDVLTAVVDATNLVTETSKINNRVHSKPIP